MLEKSRVSLALATSWAVEAEHLHDLAHIAVHLGWLRTTATLLCRAAPVALGLHAGLTVEAIALRALLRGWSHHELAETAHEAVESILHE